MSEFYVRCSYKISSWDLHGPRDRNKWGRAGVPYRYETGLLTYYAGIMKIHIEWFVEKMEISISTLLFYVAMSLYLTTFTQFTSTSLQDFQEILKHSFQKFQGILKKCFHWCLLVSCSGYWCWTYIYIDIVAIITP